MNASELLVEVRDINLARVAQLTADDLAGLVLAVRSNDVGSWQLTLPDTVLDPATGTWTKHAAAQHLRKEGAGIIVTAPGPDGTFETLLSGPMTGATYTADEGDLTGAWAFTGVSDMVLLADALAFPDPRWSADPAVQRVSNDTRTGTAEDLLRQYVGYNIASSHAIPARITGLRSKLTLAGSSQGRGPKLTKSPRFQNLLELCQEVAFVGGLNFDIVQVGSGLEFTISTPTDRTKTVRMDMANELLKAVTYGYGAPSTTLAIVAGQGEGTDRQLLSRSSADSTASETRWGRRVERFIDQRQTEERAELEQKGDEELANGAASATGLQAAPTDSDAMLYLRDWRTGDRITVVVEGQEVAAQVTEAALTIEGAAVVFVATLGDPSAFDVDAAAQRRSSQTASRVSALERTAEVPAASMPQWADIAGKPTAWDPIPEQNADAPPSAYPMGYSVFFDLNATGWPATYGTVQTIRAYSQGGGTLQLWSGYNTHIGQLWMRQWAYGATAWSDWRRVDAADWADITGKPATFAPSAHSHAWTEVTGKPTTFSPSSHTHDLSEVTMTNLGGSVDLNTLTTQGLYHQSANANAATGTNYPAALAGLLEVYSASSMTYQRYTLYNGTGHYERTRYTTTWYPWRFITDSTPWDSVTGKPTTFTPATHGHALTDANITGVLPVAQVPTLDLATKTSGTLTVARGGTGATTAAGALTALGAAAASHGHSLTDASITGVLPVAQVPTLDVATKTSGTVPVTRGGTGATTAAGALSALGAAPAAHTHAWSDVTGVPQSIHGSVSPYGGWEAYPGLEPKFTLQPDGTVILGGLIRRTASAFTASARVAYEFALIGNSLRPAQAKYLPINTSVGLTEGIVQPNGVIMFRPFSNMSVGVGVFFSLDGITYNVNH